ncbi:restriction endonuclease subunit S [Geodermatophilus amargosae]|uniref:restriction endonuclease subunit S n=1 Tax=Geodermatophilus amargosae TaxID=1296565 RepID=UPI0034DF247D
MTAARSLAHLATFVNGRGFRSEERSESGLPIVRIRQLVDPEAAVDFFDGPVEERHRVNNGDLIFSWSGTLATRLWDRGPAALNQHLFNVHPDPGVDKVWLRWAIESLLPTFRGMMHGSAMTHITNEMLRQVKIALPSIEEQRRLAEFLDDQVGRLDRAERAYTWLSDLHNERIDALIWSFLRPNPDSSMKQSSHTQMRRQLIKMVRPATWSDGDAVTAFRNGQVIARSERRADGYTEASSQQSQAQGVEAGDLVIHGLDGFAGAIGTSESDGVCSPAYHVCQVRDGDADFYGRLLRLMAVNGYLSLYGGSSRERAVDFRNWSSFSQTPIPVVSVEQQSHIGEMIRALRPLGVKIAQLQSLLDERKQALVTAAISGHLDITTARAVA